VVAVYFRGSYGRGDFRPFISDIDLAIAVRQPPPGRGYQICRSLHRRFRLVRLLNPFVRDVWQTIMTEPQWPLATRYGYLFGTEDWRLIAGKEPWSAADPIDERLMLAASWNRQHFWTVLAAQQAQQGQQSLRSLECSLKKAHSFSHQIERIDSGRFVTAPRQDSENEATSLSLSRALWELTQSAGRLMRKLGLTASRWTAPPVGEALAEPTPREQRALSEIGAVIDLDRDIIAVLGVEGLLVLVTGREWSTQDYTSVQELLSRVYQITGVLTFVYSEKSFALAPLWQGLRILRWRNGSTTSVAAMARPLLLAEQLLCQALYIGTHIWVAPGRPNPRRSLEAHVVNGLELYAFFLTGVLRRDCRSLWDALAEVASLDPEITGRLQRVAGLHRRISPGSELNPSDLFDLGSVIAERLAEILARVDVRSEPLCLMAAQ
jgi:hypothetical protein